MSLDGEHKILASLTGIKKSFYEKEVLKGVDVTIRDKEVHGFLGINGAGKSTLMNILLGDIEKSEGRIIFDQDLSIGYLPEKPALYEQMRVSEYLQFTHDIYSDTSEFNLDELIRICQLEEVKNQFIRSLSKGYRQRVGLAAAICYSPKLLVLDEPFSGLDPHAVIALKELIFKLSEEHSIFVSSHQLSELSQICTRISVLHEGKVVKTGLIDDVLRDLEGKVSIEVEFEKIDHHFLVQLKEDLGCVYEVNQNKALFHFEKDREAKVTLSKYFLDHRIVVLSQKERQLTLEDIFKEITH